MTMTCVTDSITTPFTYNTKHNQDEMTSLIVIHTFSKLALNFSLDLGKLRNSLVGLRRTEEAAMINKIIKLQSLFPHSFSQVRIDSVHRLFMSVLLWGGVRAAIIS